MYKIADFSKTKSTICQENILVCIEKIMFQIEIRNISKLSAALHFYGFN